MSAYDLCIVGAGMIGSAAARHASLNPDVKVCLIGPAEHMATGHGLEPGKGIYGAYYDEGRIARVTANLPVWALLAQRSIQRYRQLEQQSGIQFYEPVGGIIVGRQNSQFLENLERISEPLIRSGDIIKLSNAELDIRFPYFNFSSCDEGLYELLKSGYINPRKLVQAEQSIASNNGCEIIRDVVCSITSTESGMLQIATDNGFIYTSKNVLLATGASTLSRDLLKTIVPVFECSPQTVTLAEVSEIDANRMKNMPIMMYTGKGNGWAPSYPRNKDGDISFYFLPPIKYPDGKYYMKIGHSDDILERMLQPYEISEWFSKQGDPDLAKRLYSLIQTLCKGVKFHGYKRDGCVTMVTPTHHPYIDTVSPNLGVAIGGNGYAAKSCDEIGRIAVNMIMNPSWNYDIPKHVFKMLYTKKVKNSSSKL